MKFSVSLEWSDKVAKNNKNVERWFYKLTALQEFQAVLKLVPALEKKRNDKQVLLQTVMYSVQCSSINCVLLYSEEYGRILGVKCLWKLK